MITDLRSLGAFFLLIIAVSCNNNTNVKSLELIDHFDQDRPTNPWVFRSVLDANPRMITLALHDDLWVAYRTDKASIYKAWKGSVNFDGAVYNTNHGPQPTSIGDAWFVNQNQNPWRLVENGKESSLTVKYKGHRFVEKGAELKYELQSANGLVIQVSEQPEYESLENGLIALVRKFTTTGVPENATLVLVGSVGSIVSESNVKTDGKFTVVNSVPEKKGAIETQAITFNLSLKRNGTTTLNTPFGSKPMVPNSNKADWIENENKDVPQGYKLIAKSGCRTCHNTYRQTIGPAYMDVAKRYPNNETSIATLTNKVKMGGAGVWGKSVMNAHPNLELADIKAMVSYIMGLDAGQPSELEANASDADLASIPMIDNAKGVEEKDLLPGAAFRLMNYKNMRAKVANIRKKDATQVRHGVAPEIKMNSKAEFGELTEYFSFEYKGYLNIPSDGIYKFRLISDDGSNFYLHDKLTIDNDGQHGADAVDARVNLKKGLHPFKLNFFQDSGGKDLNFQWSPSGNGEFVTVPEAVLFHAKGQEYTDGTIYAMGRQKLIPGDKNPLESVHPSYDLSQARPNDFTPKVGGMDFLPDGRLVISTWDPDGAVYILNNVETGDPSKITTKLIAKGLAEPLGLKVVDGAIYVLQKQELTKLIDSNGDDFIDEYETIANSWDVSANFHEFAFGLAYKDGYFYGTLATAINPGGASTQPQIQDRGRAFKINKETGDLEFVAHGLRTPNGIGRGFQNEIFICDNQGDWLPASKMVHLKKDAFYGSRSVNFEGTAGVKEKPPVIWMPQDEIGNSPSTPIALNDGPYKDQMIYCEVTHGGVKRVFVEEVAGEYQGCLFRFAQGLESGINRMVWGPDGALYVGGIGSTGNWGQSPKLWYGLQRLKYNENPTFEMLAVRAKSNGIEIEFTEPLVPGDGWETENYEVSQFYFQPTENYGGPKLDEKQLQIKSVNVSADNKKVFLELEGMKEAHVLHVHLKEPMVSTNGNGLWTTEAWYTMNAIPKNNPGIKSIAPAMPIANTLSEYEKANGWELLFDGKTLNGWRNFKKQTIGSSWAVEDGTITLKTTEKEGGGWQAKDGGDIITVGEYENYEFTLEWKISNCGNSGIIYNVHESDDFGYVWNTGPEYQILDNTCHPDSRIKTHRAGDLYDMIECKYVTVNPAGEWNKIRLIVENGKLEHWLNGHKLVETTMFDDQWKEMIANSKFKEMKGFGTFKKGHIALQDHGDRIWFRNIKIKNLNPDS